MMNKIYKILISFMAVLLFVPTVISIGNTAPFPDDNGTGVTPGIVELTITIFDNDEGWGDPLNQAFLTNASGSWEVLDTNTEILTTTVEVEGENKEGAILRYNCSLFTMYGTKYWWSSNSSAEGREGKFWGNDTYSFTTKSENSTHSPSIIEITIVTVDSNDYPIAGVSVALDNPSRDIKYGNTTNSTGSVVFVIPKGIYIINASHSSYTFGIKYYQFDSSSTYKIVGTEIIMPIEDHYRDSTFIVIPIIIICYALIFVKKIHTKAFIIALSMALIVLWLR